MNTRDILNLANKQITDQETRTEASAMNFDRMFPFSNENIDGYLDQFDLNGKSLLTVGSSCDQAINAICAGATKVKILDINYYTRYYYSLKKAAILKLYINDYLKYFACMHEPDDWLGEDPFNEELFNFIKPMLGMIDPEAYFFWNELYKKYPGRLIYEKLFRMDTDPDIFKRTYNKYLHNITEYENTKKRILDAYVEFECNNILNYFANEKFDNIWLSNLLDYVSDPDSKFIVANMIEHLNKNGKMLVCYMFQGHDDRYDYLTYHYNLEIIQVLLSRYCHLDDMVAKTNALIYTNRGKKLYEF